MFSRGQTPSPAVLKKNDGAEKVGFNIGIAGGADRKVSEKLADTISASDFGMVGDNTTNNFPLFESARAALSGGQVLHFKSGTYYFAGSRPDLTGLKISADPGVEFRVNANPNIVEMELMSDIKFINTAHSTSITKKKNTSLDYLSSAPSMLSIGNYSQPERIFLNDANVLKGSISGTNTYGTFTGTAGATGLIWSSAFASGQEGAFIDLEIGAFYEISAKQIGDATSNGSAWRSICFPSSENKVDFIVRVGTASYSIVKNNTTEKTGSTPNGGAYALSSDGSIQMGCRVNKSLEAEFYINGTLIEKFNLGYMPEKVGFTTASFESNKSEFSRLIVQREKIPFSTKPLKIAEIGDSISYGAWATVKYDKILKEMLSGAGFGEVESVNYSVSSTNTTDWDTGGTYDVSNLNLSDVDYTLVMLGTNDVQGGYSTVVYEANLRSIISEIQSQGSKPILGVFPVFTRTDISGVTGVATSNYEKGGKYRQIVKWIAAELGLRVAEVCEHFGTNLKWYGDNIHPVEKGQMAIAAAFAKAIIADTSGAYSASSSKRGLLTTVNGWAEIANNQRPKYTIRDDRVSLSGPVTGGAEGTTICNLPLDARPTKKRSCVAACNDGSSVAGLAKIDVLTSGAVVVQDASVTPLVVWLDSVSFEREE